MWCCICFKQEEDEVETETLCENLVEKPEKCQTQIAVVQPEPDRQASVQSQRPKEPKTVKNKVDKVKPIEESSQSSTEQVSEQLSKEEPRVHHRSLIRPGSSDDNQKSRKKSELWSQEGGCKILYSIFQKQEQMLFTFKIHKLIVEQAHPISYILQPLKYLVKIRNKPIELSVCLIILHESLTKLQSSVCKIANQTHVKPMFGLLNKQEEEKLPRSYFESESIHEIVVLGKGCLRLQSIDKIIISLRDIRDFASIVSSCQKITQQYELQDMTKISFIFPSFLTLSEICLILSKLLRKFLISEKLEHIIKYLGYHLELVSSRNDEFEDVIIVSNNLNIYEPEEMVNKEFEVKLQLALRLLMIEIDNNNWKIYESLMLNFLTDKTIADYLKFIQFVHNQKKQFINKLQELKIFDQNQLEEIQNGKRIEERVINPTEKMIIIKQKIKKRFGEFFRDYKPTKTPVEQLEKKKEWDDDLRETDIKATIMDKGSKGNRGYQNNCNIFQVIDEDYVENTDLALLPNEEQLIFEQDD